MVVLSSVTVELVVRIAQPSLFEIVLL